MTDTAPEATLNLSDTDRAALGAFRSFHPASSGLHKVNLAIAAVFTLLPLGAAVAFLVSGLRNPRSHNEIGAAIFAAIALLPAAGLVYLILKLFWRVYLFENGFVLVRGGPRVVLWDDVQALYERQEVVAGIRADRRLRLLLADGRRLALDSSYRDFAALVQAAREGVTRAVLRRAAEALPRGEAVAFGKLRLSRAGLEKPGGSLPWADVHGITIEPRVDGQVHANAVVIYRRGVQTAGVAERVEWYMKLIPEFGNVEAFLRLAGQFAPIGEPKRGG